MAEVMIYHPVTEGTVSVPLESVPHYRQAGWMLEEEHQENLAYAAALAAAADKAARAPSSKKAAMGGD
jgi:hypothetical protein